MEKSGQQKHEREWMKRETCTNAATRGEGTRRKSKAFLFDSRFEVVTGCTMYWIPAFVSRGESTHMVKITKVACTRTCVSCTHVSKHLLTSTSCIFFVLHFSRIFNPSPLLVILSIIVCSVPHCRSPSMDQHEIKDNAQGEKRRPENVAIMCNIMDQY